MKMMRGEVSAKTTYQRTSSGPVVVASVDPEGKFIVLENTSSGTSRRDVDLDSYRLERDLDSKRKLSYTFRNYSLKAGKQVKVRDALVTSVAVGNVHYVVNKGPLSALCNHME
ncbi:intermediate filament protein B-like [Haliotis rubra]|uniref:intermediate filament protein B-like n=1 Tax=Haliotis rubra TaxID=36100 RepID=UPI001EE515BD|nr:intermediate filament protein B-like [Haliotis rubra]